MNNTRFLSVFALLAVFYTCSSGAATLSFAPASTTVAQDSDFFIDIVISELGDGTAPSLGDFEVNIDFNPFVLALVSVTLGTELGDVDLGEALDVSFGQTDGSLNLAMVSLLTDAELDAQPDSFVLATLQFTAVLLSPGSSTSIIFATPRVLGDAFGDPIAITGVTDTLIFGATAPIPLPAAIWLFAGAIGLLSLTRSARQLPG